MAAADTGRRTAPGAPALPSLSARFHAVRQCSLALVAPLSAEDACVQSMADASPAKWHLAHTTWFFETVVLEALDGDYTTPFAGFRVLFNSYYNGIGAQFARPERGLLTRPSLEEVRAYRRYLDERIDACLAHGVDPAIAQLIELGLEHEQQHQELLLMDIKHLLSRNPLCPAYRPAPAAMTGAGGTGLAWHPCEGGLVAVGAGPEGFAFDNERPRHQVLLPPFRLATRPVTNGEYLEFVRDGGYRRPTLWLADGWGQVQREAWQAPLYWLGADDDRQEFSLAGRRPLAAQAPVCHLSYYEADAYARWAGGRLPRECEWEHAAAQSPILGNFLESEQLHPLPATGARAGLQQLFGDVWEWTQSAYLPYPGFRALPGAVGEYNGKFMSNQMVLRGGSCATPAPHMRASYRNFFYPHNRWQFGGIRLAQDA